MDVINELIAAMSTYDVNATRVLCAPDARHWGSITEQEQGLEQLLAVMAREREIVADATFEVRNRVTTEDGAVLMLTVDGMTKSGAAFHIPVCLVIRLEGDQIVRMDEYANVDKAGALLAEIFEDG
jgi:ketosteroid isomerase-like protein